MTRERKLIFAIVALIGAYVMAQLIADIGATKLVEIGGIVMPGGTFIFALTFTLRDMVHKRLGRAWAHAAIWTAAVANIIMALYLAAIGRLPAPPFYELNEAWGAIFAIVPAITIGSIVAEIVSESVDTEVYHRWRERYPDLPQWSRVLVSNLVSLPVDSIVFTLLAFVILPPLFGAESMGFAGAAGRIISGQILFKGAVTILSLPLIYAVKDEPIKLESVMA